MAVELTGRIGVRIHKPMFRAPVLVLQVEERWNRVDEPPLHIMNRGLGWRDASLEDLRHFAQINRIDTED